MKKYRFQVILLVSIIIVFLGVFAFIKWQDTKKEEKVFKESFNNLEFISYDDYQKVLKKEGDSLVVFVNEGCDYCELYKPIINNYYNKNASLKIYVLDFASLKESEVAYVLASQEYLMSDLTWGFPLTMYIRDGKMLDKLNGLKVLEDIEEFVIKNKK